MDMFTVYKEIDDLKAEVVRGLKDRRSHPELVLIITTLDTLKKKLELKEQAYLDEMAQNEGRREFEETEHKDACTNPTCSFCHP